MSTTGCGGGRICTCGCCAPPGPATPRPIWNRPGLERLDYRVGTYATFRRAMLDGVSRHHDLRRFTARNIEDYGIALLSMWAWVADILTFYGERAVHEAFLGTAIHARSLRRLAAMIDYLPAPGVAAAADLVYRGEEGKPFEVRPGMRVQSVPGQDEKPQVFEPIETVPVSALLDRVAIFPEPIGGGAVAGALQVTLHPTFAAAEPELAPGDRLLAVMGAVVEEKQLVAVDAPDWRQVLGFRPALGTAGASFYKWRRKLRLFGHNASASWIKPTVSGTGLTWSSQTTTFTVGAGSQLYLEGQVEIGVGARILVQGDFGAQLAEVTAVVTATRTVGPLEGAVTRLTLASNLLAFDLRTVTVYELVEVIPGAVEIDLWAHTYGPTLAAGDSRLYVRGGDPAALPGVAEGKRLLLEDGAGQAVAVEVLGPPVMVNPGGVEHLEILFDPPLPRDLERVSAVLCGNAVRATHGETVAGEVLGSGDGTQPFQSFAVSRPLVTHLADPIAEHGAASTLEVRVDGIRWQAVRSFYGHGPEERIYTARADEEGITHVTFGDGLTGVRVTRGKNNVTASFRHGLGLAGRVRAETLRVALDRPAGLRSVRNPRAAQGGADPETGDAVRRNAPNGVRTFGRIISLRDFEDAAREVAGIAKAKAVERFEGGEAGVVVFVAAEEGAPLDAEGLAAVRAYLDARRNPYRRLAVRDHRGVAIVATLALAVDPDYLPEAVGDAARAAVEQYFAFEHRDLGAAVYLSDLFRVVQGVDGVLGVDFDRLVFRDMDPADPNALDLTGRRLRRDAAGAVLPLQPRLLFYGDELAVLEAPGDLVLHLGIEGL